MKWHRCTDPWPLCLLLQLPCTHTHLIRRHRLNFLPYGQMGCITKKKPATTIWTGLKNSEAVQLKYSVLRCCALGQSDGGNSACLIESQQWSKAYYYYHHPANDHWSYLIPSKRFPIFSLHCNPFSFSPMLQKVPSQNFGPFRQKHVFFSADTTWERPWAIFSKMKVILWYNVSFHGPIRVRSWYFPCPNLFL